jgi:phosphoglycerate dehydrogenase-like enzyme
MPDTEKPLVLVAMDFSDELMDTLRLSAPQFHFVQYFSDVPDSAWHDAQILYTARRFPRPDQAPNLKWVQLHSAGIDHMVNEPLFRERADITFTSASGVHVRHMSQFALMMILAFHFKLKRMFEMQQASIWRDDRAVIFAPQDLHLQTVGITGYGTIGREVARLAKGIGMTVLATKRDVMHPAQSPDEYAPPGTGDPTGDLADRLYPTEAMATMVRECDYLVNLLPLTEKTRGTINADIFEAMKPTAVLVNIGRGGVVDETALIEALKTGQIGGAALDVFETEPLPHTSPLWKMENVIISPHISGGSATYHEKAAELFLANLKRYSEKKTLYNRVEKGRGY